MPARDGGAAPAVLPHACGGRVAPRWAAERAMPARCRRSSWAQWLNAMCARCPIGVARCAELRGAESGLAERAGLRVPDGSGYALDCVAFGGVVKECDCVAAAERRSAMVCPAPLVG